MSESCLFPGFSPAGRRTYICPRVFPILPAHISARKLRHFYTASKRRLEIISNQIYEIYGLTRTNMKEKIINKSTNINEDEMFRGTEYVKGTWQ